MMLQQIFGLPQDKNSFLFMAALACSFFTIGGQAFAQDPSQQTSLLQPPAGGLTLAAIGTETGSWESNPLLAISGAKPLWGSTTSPELLFKDQTAMSMLSVDARVDENVFNQSAFNSTDVHTNTGFTTQNELWTVGLKQQTDYDTTRTSELTNFGFNNIITRHLGLGITPQVSYNPTAVDTLALAGSAATSQYQNNAFTDYNTFTLTPSYTHNVDALNSAIFSLQAQQYQTAKNNAETVNTIGPSLGWQTTLSPRFTANAQVGVQASRQYSFGTAIDPWSYNYTFAGGLTFKGMQDTINLNMARQESPYGNGTEALQTTFAGTESHALNEDFSLNFGANYLTSSYQQTGIGNLKSLLGGNIGLTYHATERVDITAAYQYRYETLTSESPTPRDNAVTVSLVYHPNVWTLLQ